MQDLHGFAWEQRGGMLVRNAMIVTVTMSDGRC